MAVGLVLSNKITLLGQRFRAGKLLRVYGKLNVTGPGTVILGNNCLIISDAIKPVCIRTLHPKAIVQLGDNTGKVITINSEHLVNDTETESRRLINSLGLEWDPACLEFHKTKCKVQTASAWQVRQPVYQSSTKRWERYGDKLDQLKKILEKE